MPMTGMAGLQVCYGSFRSMTVPDAVPVQMSARARRVQKALAMENMEANAGEQKYFDYAVELPAKADVVAKFKENTVKGSQFKQPLLEFSGACAGCGETPYAKLITQLFGDRMYIANATGCSSIWGNSSPSTPYTVNEKGQGPAWCNSLFEDNAEFGYGMLLAQKAIRDGLKTKVESVMANEKASEDVKAACQEWLDTFSVGATNGAATDKLVAGSGWLLTVMSAKTSLRIKTSWLRNPSGSSVVTDGLTISDLAVLTMFLLLAKTSTSWYSIPRFTPTQADRHPRLPRPVQSLSSLLAVKKTKKKDMASIAMSYGYVYVAQICHGC